MSYCFEKKIVEIFLVKLNSNFFFKVFKQKLVIWINVLEVIILNIFKIIFVHFVKSYSKIFKKYFILLIDIYKITVDENAY